MNEAQKAAINRALTLINNARAGAYKLNVVLNRPEATLESFKQFATPYANGLDALGASATDWLTAAINDRDYPAEPAPQK